MEDLFQIGIITATHGLKGEVKVYPTTDDPTRFKSLDAVFLDVGKNTDKEPLDENLRTVHIRSARVQKDRVIVGFKEFSDINEIEPFKKCALYVTRENAVPLGENEYYVADLIGLSGVLDDGRSFGTLTDVLQTGANDVYVFDVNGNEVLIPAIRDCVLRVDLNARVMMLHLLGGLVDAKILDELGASNDGAAVSTGDLQ